LPTLLSNRSVKASEVTFDVCPDVLGDVDVLCDGFGEGEEGRVEVGKVGTVRGRVIASSQQRELHHLPVDLVEDFSASCSLTCLRESPNVPRRAELGPGLEGIWDNMARGVPESASRSREDKTRFAG